MQSVDIEYKYGGNWNIPYWMGWERIPIITSRGKGELNSSELNNSNWFINVHLTEHVNYQAQWEGDGGVI